MASGELDKPSEREKTLKAVQKTKIFERFNKNLLMLIILENESLAGLEAYQATVITLTPSSLLIASDLSTMSESSVANSSHPAALHAVICSKSSVLSLRIYS